MHWVSRQLLLCRVWTQLRDGPHETCSGTATLKVLAAPQVLDEGIDVPAAELAVVVAASRTDGPAPWPCHPPQTKCAWPIGRSVFPEHRGGPSTSGRGVSLTVLPYARNLGRFSIETQVSEIEEFLRLPAIPDEKPEPEQSVTAPEPAPESEPEEPLFDLDDTEWDLDFDEDYYDADDVKTYLEQIARAPLLNAEKKSS